MPGCLGGHTALTGRAGRNQPPPWGHAGTTRPGSFDKVAKLLDIGYPGGIVIDRLASAGNPEAFHFPRSRFDRESLEFSFSGLKTAAANFIRQNGRPAAGAASGTYALEDFAASFQEAIVDVLVSKSFKAAEQCGLSRIAAVGGVAANSGLRQKLSDEARSRRMRLFLPPVRFCTDNAVMIASAAHRIWMRSGFQGEMLEVDAFSR